MRKPALTGSVQADPRTGKDRFTLTARWSRGSAAADQEDAGGAASGR